MHGKRASAYTAKAHLPVRSPAGAGHSWGVDWTRVAEDKREPTQKTDKGLEIPIPKRKDFERLVEKVAGRPAGCKSPPSAS
jgi:hypothetical protein